MTQLTKREQKYFNAYTTRINVLENAIIQALLCLQQEPKLVVTAVKILDEAVESDGS